MNDAASLKPKPGGPVPLFDRLSDEFPLKRERELSPRRVYDRDGVFQSVHRELRRLCNTRSCIPMSKWSGRDHTVYDYGLPDYAHLSTRDGGHRVQLARIIEEAISAYEPRLRNPKLTSLPDDPNIINRFRYNVSGLLVIGKVVEPISFPLDL